MSTLRTQMTQDMIIRGLATSTQQAYLHAVTELSDYYHRRGDRNYGEVCYGVTLTFASSCVARHHITSVGITYRAVSIVSHEGTVIDTKECHDFPCCGEPPKHLAGALVVTFFAVGDNSYVDNCSVGPF